MITETHDADAAWHTADEYLTHAVECIEPG
jgi:hypothetical protein